MGDDHKQNMSERDLLIELRTQVRFIGDDVKELKDDTKERLTVLETQKLSKEEASRIKGDADLIHQDHETRLRRVERWGFTAIGALYVIEFALRYFKL